MCTLLSANTHQCHLRVTGDGVGVHRTRLRSLFFALLPPSQPAFLSIASALFTAAVPNVLLSRSRLAAGVRLPGAFDRRGVHEGGAMFPFLGVAPGVLETPGVRPTEPSPSKPALTRKLLEALFESLWDMASRDEMAGMLKGVLGVGRSAGSSLCEMMRGVAFSVPHVISCLTAAGPSSDGVGEGRFGTREKFFRVGELGRSGK